MNPPSIHVYPITNAVCFLFSVLLFRMANGQLAFEYQVSRKAIMGMGRIMRVPGQHYYQPSIQRMRGSAFDFGDTHGPSAQVKTRGKPHERTSASD